MLTISHIPMEREGHILATQTLAYSIRQSSQTHRSKDPRITPTLSPLHPVPFLDSPAEASLAPS
jgi:hypothetical protein